METIEAIFGWAATSIDLIGVSILIYGFTKSLIKYFLLEAKNIKHVDLDKIQRLRRELGIYLLLALDFMIASDIIYTISELSQQQLISLSAMIVLRIAIGYFLSKEINEIQTVKNG